MTYEKKKKKKVPCFSELQMAFLGVGSEPSLSRFFLYLPSLEQVVGPGRRVDHNVIQIGSFVQMVGMENNVH